MSRCTTAHPFTPDSLTYSVPLLLKGQCDRTPGEADSKRFLADGLGAYVQVLTDTTRLHVSLHVGILCTKYTGRRDKGSSTGRTVSLSLKWCHSGWRHQFIQHALAVCSAKSPPPPSTAPRPANRRSALCARTEAPRKTDSLWARTEGEEACPLRGAQAAAEGVLVGVGVDEQDVGLPGPKTAILGG